LLVGLAYEEMMMNLKTIALAGALALSSTMAFAQAPIGSDATIGNRAMLNRGPDRTNGEDMDFQNKRSWGPRYYRHARSMKHRRHVAERR
jgi:hypothetical protein